MVKQNKNPSYEYDMQTVGGILAVAYTILVPILDIAHLVAGFIGKSQPHNPELQTFVYNSFYIPLLLLLGIWVYGFYKKQKTINTKDITAWTPLFAITVSIVCISAYYILSMYFGFLYHFVW